MKNLSLAVLVAAIFSSSANAYPYSSQLNNGYPFASSNEITSCIAVWSIDYLNKRKEGDESGENIAKSFVGAWLNLAEFEGYDGIDITNIAIDKMNAGKQALIDIERFSGGANLPIDQALDRDLGYCRNSLSMFNGQRNLIKMGLDSARSRNSLNLDR